MSEASPSRSPRSAVTAPVLVILGFLVAAAAWMLPVNIKSVSPSLLQAAGAGTPTLGAFGRDLVDVEKIGPAALRSEEHTSELQSRSDLVCRLLLEKKKKKK